MTTVIQNVTGSGNVFTATGDVYHVSYHSEQPTVEESRNLAHLRDLVRQTWITDVLQHSVHQAARIELGMRSEPGAVEHPWRRYLETVGGPGVMLPPEKTIGRVLEDAGRMLLILGEPGSGKTTTLLTLAEACIEQMEREPTAPVPVVLNLSTWAESGGSIHGWLLKELGARYYVGRPLARRWLKRHRLLLLLDGLDEVVPSRRAACVDALHTFVEEHGVPGIVVCCRSNEYGELPRKLKLGGAVSLLPLEQEQIDVYLAAAGPQFDGLRAALDHQEELGRLAESPLMLSIMTLAFCGDRTSEIRFESGSTPAELRDKIFGRYVDRMFNRRERRDAHIPRERAEAWLQWMATGMARRGESIFAVELLQPVSLTRWPLLLYTLISRIAGSLSISVMVGMAALAMIAFFARDDDTWTMTPALPIAFLLLFTFAGFGFGLLYVPIDYLRLCRAPRRQHSFLVRFILGFLRFSVYAFVPTVAASIAFFAALGPDYVNSPRLKLYSSLYFYTLTAVPYLAMFFGAKSGRGDANQDIGVVGILGWRWLRALMGALKGLAVGMIVRTIFFPSQEGSLYVCCIGGLLIGSLYGGWRHTVPKIELSSTRFGRSTVVNSGKALLYIGLNWIVVSLLLVLLLTVLSDNPFDVRTWGEVIFFGIPIVGPALFWFGGMDFVLHGSLRFVLSVTHIVPLRLHRFLGYAVHLGILQRAGGGYMFIHRLLLEHFASRPAPSRDLGASAT